MADTSGQAEIRGIDIDKAAKGFAEEAYVFKETLCFDTPTSAREIRWYQKTAATITGTTTTGITSNNLANTDQLALPAVAEQSWTRSTSYVRKYFVESPMISSEDIKDSDIDVLTTNLRDLSRAVASAVDARIWAVLTESQSAVNINSVTIAAGNEWDSATIPNRDPIQNILTAIKEIQEESYNPYDNGYLCLSPKDFSNIMGNANVRNAGQFYTADVTSTGRVGRILGLSIIVSNNVTADYAAVIVKGAGTWKNFMDITARTIEEVGIGTKIRVWEEGEAILHDPKMITLISNTQA